MIILLLLPAAALAQPDEAIQAEVERQLDEYQLDAWEAYWSGVSPEQREFWGGQSISGMLKRFTGGEADGEYSGKLERIFQLLLAAVKENLAALGMIFGVALISGVVGILLSGGESQELRGVTTFVCYGMCVTAVSFIIASLVNSAGQAIERLAGFCETVTPALALMLAAVGAAASSGLVRPLTAFMSQTVMAIFKNVILPLIVATAVLAVAGNLAEKSKLRQLTGAIKSVVKWIIGIVFTVYLGLVSIQGVSMAGVDSISIRTLKYTLGSAVPVVGGMVSGTLDTTRGCAVLIKNAAGVTAVAVGVCLILMPVLKIAAASLALKVTAAVCEPLSDGRMGRMISDVADTCNYLAAAVVVAAVMFVMTVALFIAAGNMGL